MEEKTIETPLCACGCGQQVTISNQSSRRGQFNKYVAGHNGKCNKIIDGKKLCGKCGKRKLVEEFYQKKFRIDSYCKLCSKEDVKQSKYSKTERAKIARRKRALRVNYGITPEEYDEILSSQGGVCAICKKEHYDALGRLMSLDHCHASNLVRGILCNRCNRAIGLLYDNAEIAMSAALYLEKYKLLHEQKLPGVSNKESLNTSGKPNENFESL